VLKNRKLQYPEKNSTHLFVYCRYFCMWFCNFWHAPSQWTKHAGG